MLNTQQYKIHFQVYYNLIVFYIATRYNITRYVAVFNKYYNVPVKTNICNLGPYPTIQGHTLPRLRIQPILSDTEVYTIPTLGMGGSGWAPVQGPVQRLETLDRMLNNIFYISIEERIISLKTCHCRCILFWHRIIF